MGNEKFYHKDDGEMGSWVSQCHERHARIEAALTRIGKLLDGNGSVGLITEVARMKDRTEKLEESLVRGTAKFDLIESKLNSIRVLVIILAFTAGGNIALKIAELAAKH
jgi:fumarate hydratase class II